MTDTTTAFTAPEGPTAFDIRRAYRLADVLVRTQAVAFAALAALDAPLANLMPIGDTPAADAATSRLLDLTEALDDFHAPDQNAMAHEALFVGGVVAVRARIDLPELDQLRELACLLCHRSVKTTLRVHDQSTAAKRIADAVLAARQHAACAGVL
jgi:hypothetical protein